MGRKKEELQRFFEFIADTVEIWSDRRKTIYELGRIWNCEEEWHEEVIEELIYAVEYYFKAERKKFSACMILLAHLLEVAQQEKFEGFYGVHQLGELFRAIAEGVDVNLVLRYAKPSTSLYDMERLRELLKKAKSDDEIDVIFILFENGVQAHAIKGLFMILNRKEIKKLRSILRAGLRAGNVKWDLLKEYYEDYLSTIPLIKRALLSGALLDEKALLQTDQPTSQTASSASE